MTILIKTIRQEEEEKVQIISAVYLNLSSLEDPLVCGLHGAKKKKKKKRGGHVVQYNLVRD